MANDEFDVYFARAKVEENWNTEYDFYGNSAYTEIKSKQKQKRRCSLPAISTTSTSANLLSRNKGNKSGVAGASSSKNVRKKSVPYGSHDFSRAFPSPILEVTSPTSETEEGEQGNVFKFNNVIDSGACSSKSASNIAVNSSTHTENEGKDKGDSVLPGYYNTDNYYKHGCNKTSAPPIASTSGISHFKTKKIKSKFANGSTECLESEDTEGRCDTSNHGNYSSSPSGKGKKVDDVQTNSGVYNSNKKSSSAAQVFVYPSLNVSSDKNNQETIAEEDEEDDDEQEEDGEEGRHHFGPTGAHSSSNLFNTSNQLAFPALTKNPHQRSDSELCIVRSFKTSSKGIIDSVDSVKHSAYHRRASTATCKYEPMRIQPRFNIKNKTGAPELSSLDLSATKTLIEEESLQLYGLKSILSQGYSRMNGDLSKNGFGDFEGDLDILGEPLDVITIVVVTGEKSVGKSALIRQFMTSSYMGPLDSPQEQTTPIINLSVAVDGEETDIQLHEVPAKQLPQFPSQAGAYLLVFAVDSQSSYDRVKSQAETCMVMETNPAVILVANKTDLARRRVISSQEARAFCKKIKCKYVEVSVSLNHNVDNLLVGTVKQIKLLPLRIRMAKRKGSASNRKESVPDGNNCGDTNDADIDKSEDRSSKTCFPLPKGFSKKFSLKNVRSHSHDCENLSVL